MPNKRLTPAIHVTVSDHLLAYVDDRAREYGLTRSFVVRQALSEWLRNHRTLRPLPAALVNGQPYDPNKPFRHYFTAEGEKAGVDVLAEYQYAADEYQRYR